MLGLDNSNQYIDWWHESLPDESGASAHSGTLNSIILRPTIMVGLSNYWNITLIQDLGYRWMDWQGDSLTIHHRDEGSDTDFVNAKGGFLGDTRIMAKYLILNDGQGPGTRFFIGGGIVLPSKNTLTSDPFFSNGEQKNKHRHFSISEGVYKGVFETQFYKKGNGKLVFLGGSFSLILPIKKNKYGFMPGTFYDFSTTAFTNPIDKINASPSFNLSLMHNNKSSWNNIKSPNSGSTIVTAGMGLLWNLEKYTFAFNLQKPFFLDGAFSGVSSEVKQIDNRVGALQLSISVRRVLSYTIPWLDPFKNL